MAQPLYKIKKMNCPKCNSEIKIENINIQSNTAQCNSCDNIFKISENLGEYLDSEFDISNSPKGTWTYNEYNKTIIGATTRSPIAFFLVPFMLIWSGGSLGGLYGTQIKSGEFDLFQSLFGIPFIIGSVIFWSIALMTIWGKVELTLDNRGGKIFTGIGKIGMNKIFLWSEISRIEEKQANIRYPGSLGNRITLEGKKRISFGNGLKEDRLYYLFCATKTMMNKNR